MHRPFAHFFRRRFRYRLRTLLVVVTLAGVALAWVHRAHEQRRAVDALRKSNPGATVQYDDSGFLPHRWVGVDYQASVVSVEMFYATDADIEGLTRFPRLDSVLLERSIDLTDQGLATLAKIRTLRLLVLADAEQISDAGLRQLEKLSSLEWLQLDLGRHRVSRQTLESLRRALPKCRIEVGGSLGEKPDLAAVAPRAPY